MSSTSSLSSSRQTHRAPSPQARATSREPTHTPSPEGTGALAALIRRGDLPERVKGIVKLALLDAQDRFGNTILMQAIAHGRVNTVGVLLEAGANPSVRNHRKEDALSIAENLPYVKSVTFIRKARPTKGWASLGKERLKQISGLIIDKIFSRNIDPGTGKTSLMAAAEKGRAASVDLLLGMNSSNVDSVDSKGLTAVMHAASSGNLPTLGSLLKVSKDDIDKTANDGNTALTIAAKKGHILVVKRLIQAKATVDGGNRSGCTALIDAAGAGNIGMVRLLIESRANLNATEEEDRSVLTKAAQSGDVGLITLLIESGADVNATDGENESALTEAAKRGDVGLITLIGKNMERLDSDDDGAGWDAISHAAAHNQTTSIETLIKLGVRIDLESSRGVLALRAAASHGNSDMIGKLLASAIKMPRKESINMALRKGAEGSECTIIDHQMAVIDQMIALRADVNSSSNEGQTALMHAAIQGDHPVVKKLLALGATIDARNRFGWTALMHAAKQGHDEIVGQLIESGANVRAQDHNSETAFVAAAAAGHLETAERFMALKDIPPSADDLLRALQKAAKGGHLPLVERIIPLASKDLNSRGKDGNTPLIEAAAMGHVAVVRCLIEAKADLNTKGFQGRTALMQAVVGRRDNLENPVVKLLIQKGANKELRDERDWTALMLAQEQDARSAPPQKTADFLLSLGVRPLSREDSAVLAKKMGRR